MKTVRHNKRSESRRLVWADSKKPFYPSLLSLEFEDLNIVGFCVSRVKGKGLFEPEVAAFPQNEWYRGSILVSGFFLRRFFVFNSVKK